MNSVKDEYTSHITDISEVTLNFFDKSGMCGYPTVLGILGIMAMHPEAYQWLSKSGIDLLPKLELGDTVHWYKIKYDLKSNIRRSVPISLLNGTNMFTTKSIPEPISGASAIHISKTSVYFTTQTGTKVCSKSELDLRNCKSISVGIILDVISKGDYDYILTNSVVYRINNKTYDTPTKILDNTGMLSAFCLADNVIIVASADGGYRISDIAGTVPMIGKITRETGTHTSTTTDSSGNSTQTNISYDNGVPRGACNYCWYDGSKYYIGDYSTCGTFDPSATSFKTEYVEGNSHPPYLTSGVNRSHNGVLYAEKSGGLQYGSTHYNVTGVKSVLELDNVILFGTNSGIKVFTKSSVDGKYGPQEMYVSLAGVNGTIDGMCLLYGNIFVVTQNAKYRTFDSEEDDNKLRFIVFGTDYEVDLEANETDAKEVKMNLLDLLDLGSSNSKVFDSKLSKANRKTAMYAIGIYNSKPKVFNLYGHDNRNAPAVELNNCMESFDMKG